MKKILMFLILGMFLINTVSAISTISLISPTPADQSHSPNNYIFVNTSYLEANFVNVTYELLDYNEVILNTTTYLTPINSTNFTGLSEGIYQIRVILYDNAPEMTSTGMRMIAVSSSAGTYVEPFDFKTIFLNYFLGNSILFPFAFIILISLLAGYFQVPDKAFMIILTIGSVMFGTYMGEVYYVLILFIVGFLIYKSFSRIFQ